MIQIKINKDPISLSNDLDNYYKKVTEGRRKIKVLNQWCISHLNSSFEEIVKASPNQLIRYAEQIDALPEEVKKQIIRTHTNSNGNEVESCYCTDTLYEQMNMKKKKNGNINPSYEGKKLLIDTLHLTVCPYCNRNFIYSSDTSEDEDYITGCQLDHFFSKAKYPILAISFYNLIPSCATCNRLKNKDEIKFYPHLPYKNIDDLLRFSYKLESANYSDSTLVINYLDDGMRSQFKLLGLHDLYQCHNEIIADILIKNDIFNSTYFNALSNDFKSIFHTPLDAKAFIYGANLVDNDYSKKPLLKMTSDIVKEVIQSSSNAQPNDG